MEDMVYTNDYTEFNSAEFCKKFYSVVESPVYPRGQQTFLLNTLSDIYNNGEITGTTLLDIGTGPTIYNLISAAQHIPNIYLSDFSANNRDALWRWLQKDPAAHDFSNFFQHVSRYENLRQPWQSLEDDMRSRIKAILPCDISLESPLHSCRFPQFDVISSSLCLSVEPRRTTEGYETAVKNVVSLLKPGGWVVYIDNSKCTYFEFGNQRYGSFPIGKEDVDAAFRKAGCQIKSYVPFMRSLPEREISDDGEAFFVMTAKKMSNK